MEDDDRTEMVRALIGSAIGPLDAPLMGRPIGRYMEAVQESCEAGRYPTEEDPETGETGWQVPAAVMFLPEFLMECYPGGPQCMAG